MVRTVITPFENIQKYKIIIYTTYYSFSIVYGDETKLNIANCRQILKIPKIISAREACIKADC
jgi:hypothetical protein